MTLTAEETHHHLSLPLDASTTGPRPHISTTIGTIAAGLALALLGGVIAKHVTDPGATGPVLVTVGLMLLLTVVIQCSVSWYLHHRAAAQLASAAARRDVEQDAALHRQTEELREEIRTEVRSGMDAVARLAAAAAAEAVRQELSAKSAVDELNGKFDELVDRVESDMAAMLLSRAPKASVAHMDKHRH